MAGQWKSGTRTKTALLRGFWPSAHDRSAGSVRPVRAGFPPFAHLALLRAEAQQADAAQHFLQAAKQVLRAHDAVLEMHGPLPAPMPRRAGLHRVQLLLSSPERRALHRLLDLALPQIHALPEARRTRWSLDVDPMDLY